MTEPIFTNDCDDLNNDFQKKKYSFIDSCDLPEVPDASGEIQLPYPVVQTPQPIPMEIPKTLLAALLPCCLKDRFPCPTVIIDTGSYNYEPDYYLLQKDINIGIGTLIVSVDLQAETCCCDDSCGDTDTITLKPALKLEFDCDSNPIVSIDSSVSQSVDIGYYNLSVSIGGTGEANLCEGIITITPEIILSSRVGDTPGFTDPNYPIITGVDVDYDRNIIEITETPFNFTNGGVGQPGSSTTREIDLSELCQSTDCWFPAKITSVAEVPDVPNRWQYTVNAVEYNPETHDWDSTNQLTTVAYNLNEFIDVDTDIITNGVEPVIYSRLLPAQIGNVVFVKDLCCPPQSEAQSGYNYENNENICYWFQYENPERQLYGILESDIALFSGSSVNVRLGTSIGSAKITAYGAPSYSPLPQWYYPRGAIVQLTFDTRANIYRIVDGLVPDVIGTLATSITGGNASAEVTLDGNENLDGQTSIMAYPPSLLCSTETLAAGTPVMCRWFPMRGKWLIVESACGPFTTSEN